MSADKQNEAVSKLCQNCGLCCDSTLFADVELRAGDDTKRLHKFGLTLAKKGQRKLAFAQPCACFDGKLCRIYYDRPERCRSFECGLLKKIETGELKTEAALKKIAAAKILAEKVRCLVRSLGQGDERLALTERYSQAMSAPIDLSSSENDPELRGELMLAVNDLMRILQRDFLHR